MTTRFMLRCPLCLGVWAFDAEVPERLSHSPWTRKTQIQTAVAPALNGCCPYECGAGEDYKPELMGAVEDTRLLKHEGGKLPENCDHSCVFARGPKCECPCGGCNHGGGILVLVDKLVDNGSVHARFVAAPKGVEKARERATEWLVAKALAETSQGLLSERAKGLRAAARARSGGYGYLSHEEYQVERAAQTTWKLLRDLPLARTHKSRMDKAALIVRMAQRHVPGMVLGIPQAFAEGRVA